MKHGTLVTAQKARKIMTAYSYIQMVPSMKGSGSVIYEAALVPTLIPMVTPTKGTGYRGVDMAREFIRLYKATGSRYDGRWFQGKMQDEGQLIHSNHSR